MNIITKIITELEDGLRLRREDLNDQVQSSEKIEIQIVGQMSLLMNEEVSSRIRLAITKDVDALLKGKWGVTQLF